MTPSERDRRIEVGGGHKNLPPYFDSRSCPQCLAERAVAEALDLDEILGRVERAEAAASDFARALVAARAMLIREFGERDPLAPWDFVDDALARHPSFSGEEGTEG